MSTQKEGEMLVRFLEKTYPGRQIWVRKRIGPMIPKHLQGTLTPEQEKFVGIYRPKVDAIVLLDDRVLLLEAKVRNDLAAIGELLAYLEIFPKTPELAEISHLPTSMMIVADGIYEPLSTVALMNGIEYIVFSG